MVITQVKISKDMSKNLHAVIVCGFCPRTIICSINLLNFTLPQYHSALYAAEEILIDELILERNKKSVNYKKKNSKP